MDAETEVNAETVAVELGFGKFQILSMFFIILAMFSDGLGSNVFIFASLDSQYRCKITECEGPGAQFNTSWLTSAIPVNDLSEQEKCSRYDVTDVWNSTVVDDCYLLEFNSSSTSECNRWVYGEGDTIVKEFDLACQQWKHALVGTMNGIGQFICLMYVGFLSDKFGRRILMVYSTFARGVVGVIQSFAPEYWSYMFLEFLNTALATGGYSAAYVLGAELFPSKHRVKGTMIITFIAGFSTLSLGFMATGIPYWRTLLRVVFSPSILMIVFILVIPESIRWLIARKRYTDASALISKAARYNNVQLSDRTQNYVENLGLGKISEDIQENVEKVPFLAIFRSRRLTIRLVVCAFCWITNVLVYYALSINSVDISSDNGFLNYLLVSGTEILSLVVYFLLVDRLGRKISLSGSLILCGLACIAYTFTPQNMVVLELIFYLSAKLFISFAFNVVYIYTSELFPTTLRHTCLACCSMLGRIGNILAPQTSLMSAWHSSLPMSLFAVIAIASGLSTLTFPETLNTELPETLADAENIVQSKQKVNEVTDDLTL